MLNLEYIPYERKGGYFQSKKGFMFGESLNPDSWLGVPRRLLLRPAGTRRKGRKKPFLPLPLSLSSPSTVFLHLFLLRQSRRREREKSQSQVWAMKNTIFVSKSNCSSSSFSTQQRDGQKHCKHEIRPRAKSLAAKGKKYALPSKCCIARTLPSEQETEETISFPTPFQDS